MRLKQWFCGKNFSEVEIYLIETADSEEVISETDMAVKVRWVTKYGEIIKWIPKSCILRDKELDARAKEYMEIRYSGEFDCPFRGLRYRVPIKLKWNAVEGKVTAVPCEISYDDYDCADFDYDRDVAAEWCSVICGKAETLDEANEIARIYETYFY